MNKEQAKAYEWALKQSFASVAARYAKTLALFIKETLDRPDAHCPDCEADKTVFCPRDNDALCLVCHKSFCGAHIGKHLKEVHCVSLNLDHCSRRQTQSLCRRMDLGLRNTGRRKKRIAAAPGLEPKDNGR